MKSLSARPQNGSNRLPDGASRFAKDGTLVVKRFAGRWVTYQRFVAEIFAHKCGVQMPTHGIRIELTDPINVCPATLLVKSRGGARVPLTRWVKGQQRLAA